MPRRFDRCWIPRLGGLGLSGKGVEVKGLGFRVYLEFRIYNRVYLRFRVHLGFTV